MSKLFKIKKYQYKSSLLKNIRYEKSCFATQLFGL
jgi:hypothetical protein